MDKSVALKIKVTEEGPSTLGAGDDLLRVFSLSARHLKCSGMSLRRKGRGDFGIGLVALSSLVGGSSMASEWGILYANGGIALWAVRKST